MFQDGVGPKATNDQECSDKTNRVDHLEVESHSSKVGEAKRNIFSGIFDGLLFCIGERAGVLLEEIHIWSEVRVEKGLIDGTSRM